MPSWFNSTVRLWIYGVIIAAFAVLLFYNILDESAIPVWTGLVVAILGIGGHSVAAATLVAQRRSGEVEPTSATPRTARRHRARKAKKVSSGKPPQNPKQTS